jgi:hypothetical protein
MRLDLSKKAQPFHFAVSTRAIFIPRIKLIAKTVPVRDQRLLKNDAANASLRVRIGRCRARVRLGGCVVEPLREATGSRFAHPKLRYDPQTPGCVQ